MPIAIRLSSQSKVPKYRQIFEIIRHAILTGELKPGEKLPSSRIIADKLGISRESVSRSFTELASQGYVVILPASGVIVNPRGLVVTPRQDFKTKQQAAASKEVPPPELSHFGNRLIHAHGLAEPGAYLTPELNFDAPMLDELPVARWKEAVKRASTLQDPSLMSYINDPFGLMPLREAIAAYLARNRFISCSPEQIAVFTTTEGGTDLICRLLLQESDNVIVENPGSPAIRLTFHMHGAKTIGVPVDEQGLVVDELKKLSERAKLAYITPSHHDPTGVVMTEQRRHQLLEWANSTDTYIIEDDFDSEYRYGEKPVAALKGLPNAERVIYRYNFWRVLYPLARLSFMVMPENLVPLIFKARAMVERDVPVIEQKALADFLNDGQLEVHIRRTKTLYARRRAALVQALTKHLGKEIIISPVSGGMHVLVRFQEPVTDERVLAAARHASLPLVSIADRYTSDPPRGRFLVAFAHRDEHEFEPMVSHFAKELA